jgi:site-specific DNA-methyltransferase (adenine-specific)
LETLKRFPENSVDSVVTDPPYGLGKEPDVVEVMKSWIETGFHEVKGSGFMGKEWDVFVPQPLIWKEVLRVLKPGGHILCFSGTRTVDWMGMALRFAGFEIRDTMIYYKINPIPRTHNRYEQYFEYMFVVSKGKPKTFNPIMIDKNYKSDREKQGMGRNSDGTIKYVNNINDITTKIKGNVWEYYTGGFHTTSDKVAYSHPATFPEKLAQDHIMSWSNENDLVYDPFMGSGTTAKMCLLNKRRYIGSEISEEYYKISLERMKSVNYEYLF